MDRVMVSWNVPNLVTINLMAWLGFLAFILFYQGIAKRRGGSSTAGPASAGSNEIADLGY